MGSPLCTGPREESVVAALEMKKKVTVVLESEAMAACSPREIGSQVFDLPI